MSNPSVGPGMGPDGRQKSTIMAILSIIETGQLPNQDAYRTTVILPDGAGISYGKHQSTDKSDILDTILVDYVGRGGAYAAELEPLLSLVTTDFTTTVDPSDPSAEVLKLMAVLRKCGRDPVMQTVQDEVFDERCWLPALRLGQKMRLELPLSYLLVYDTTVQSGVGGVASIRKRFPAVPPSLGGDERVWAEQYARARLAWLQNFEHPSQAKQRAVRTSAYRMEAVLSDILVPGNWELWTPLTFRGVVVP